MNLDFKCSSDFALFSADGVTTGMRRFVLAIAKVTALFP